MTQRAKRILDAVLGGGGVSGGAMMADWTGLVLFSLGALLLLARIARHTQHMYHEHYGFSRGTDQSPDHEEQ